jgi:hypothetical protein
MTVKSILVCTAIATAAAFNPPTPVPSSQQVAAASDWCGGENSGDRKLVCEVREYTVPATGGVLAVDAKPNGGIDVQGGGRSDVHVYAKVVATAESKERAKQIATAVQVTAAADRISATGPARADEDESWSVSYRLAVPERTSLALESTNGGISIANVDGQIGFKTINGGVKLSALSGEVKGRTNNGGVSIDFDGPSWQGEGLDVETHNGGVKLTMPDNYSAHLQTGTVNGGLQLGIPMETQPDGRRQRSVDTQLGAGGALIRVHTTNGGIRLTRK